MGSLTTGRRDVYCEGCGTATRVTAEACRSYGELVDVLRMQAR